jgi:hypothetical protein
MLYRASRPVQNCRAVVIAGLPVGYLIDFAENHWKYEAIGRFIWLSFLISGSPDFLKIESGLARRPEPSP